MEISSNDSPRKKGDNIYNNDLPMGFANALAKNTSALGYFANLTDDMKERIVDQTRNIRSKGEMQQFIDGLVPRI